LAALRGAAAAESLRQRKQRGRWLSVIAQELGNFEERDLICRTSPKAIGR
jgi:hypothetical protein